MCLPFVHYLWHTAVIRKNNILPKLVYPFVFFFADEIVENILPIAMEYQTIDLMQQCEAFLLQKYFTAKYPFSETPHIDMVVECLDKAVRYGLKELQKRAEGLLARCVLHTYESLEKYTQLPGHIQNSILRQRVKKLESKYREDPGTHPSSKCMITIKKDRWGFKEDNKIW